MSQLARMVRARLRQETDYDVRVPGDLAPDVSEAGVPTPYLVCTQSESIVVYDLSGLESHITETCTILIVASSRQEANDLNQWIREQLRPPGWRNVSTDPGSDYVLLSMRVESFTSSGAEPNVDGDDTLARTCTLSVSGTFSFTGNTEGMFRDPVVTKSENYLEKPRHG